MSQSIQSLFSIYDIKWVCGGKGYIKRERELNPLRDSLQPAHILDFISVELGALAQRLHTIPTRLRETQIKSAKVIIGRVVISPALSLVSERTSLRDILIDISVIGNTIAY